MGKFYISVSNGLLEGDHELRMGTAVWQFMWCLDKITKVDEKGIGWVLGGKPLKLDEISKNRSRDTISRNLNTLKKQGYINLRRTPYGLVISVNKAKKRFGNNAELGSAKMSNLLRKNVESNKTYAVDSNKRTQALNKFREQREQLLRKKSI